MKRVLFAVILLFGMGLFSSCEKEGSSQLIGTWDNVEEPGDFIVITKTTITFYYADNDGMDNGIPYQYEYEHPHIFIAGVNTWDVISKSSQKMVWESTWDYERITLKKR